MNARTSVVNISGDFEESLVQLARHLGTNQLRRVLLQAVYGRGDKPKTKRQLMLLANIDNVGTNSQQAQNELDHLAKHHLIVKMRSDKRLDDGSRNLYTKDPTIRANRKRIIFYADNPQRAADVPTKRRQVLVTNTLLKTVTPSALKKRKQLNVLYLASNPDWDCPLRIDIEVHRVQEAIRGSKYRDNVRIEYRPAPDLQSLIDGLNDLRPTIVHFSGHGNTQGIVADNQQISEPEIADISYQTLAKALSATDAPPRVVVLNSCYSIASHIELLEVVDILIGMNKPISDIAAATFAPNFYAALAAGQSVRASFDQARLAVETASLGEDLTVELRHTSAINPRNVILA
jgi:hypothetical protein